MNDNARRRLAQKTARTKQAEEQAALQQAIAGLDPEYVTKLRRDSLVAAHDRLRESATPEEIVREAERHFESRIRFLTEKLS